MKIKITVELRNSLIHGNTDVVTAELVYWDWEEVNA